MIAVHARPGARRSTIVGAHGDALAIRVAARPVEGAANRALLELLAETLGVPATRLSLEAGEHGRQKRVRVDGMDAGVVAARLAPATAVDTGRRGA